MATLTGVLRDENWKWAERTLSIALRPEEGGKEGSFEIVASPFGDGELRAVYDLRDFQTGDVGLELTAELFLGAGELFQSREWRRPILALYAWEYDYEVVIHKIGGLRHPDGLRLNFLAHGGCARVLEPAIPETPKDLCLHFTIVARLDDVLALGTDLLTEIKAARPPAEDEPRRVYPEHEIKANGDKPKHRPTVHLREASILAGRARSILQAVRDRNLVACRWELPSLLAHAQLVATYLRGLGNDADDQRLSEYSGRLQEAKTLDDFAAIAPHLYRLCEKLRDALCVEL